MNNLELYLPDDGSIRGETYPREYNVKQESIYTLPNTFIFWYLVHREIKHER